LQLDRALRVLEPIFRDLAESFHHVDQFGVFALDLPLLARLQVSRHGLAALLDHAGEIAGQLLDVDRGGFVRFSRRSHVIASIRRPGACWALAVPLTWALTITPARRRSMCSPRNPEPRANGRLTNLGDLAFVILTEYR